MEDLRSFPYVLIKSEKFFIEIVIILVILQIFEIRWEKGNNIFPYQYKIKFISFRSVLIQS